MASFFARREEKQILRCVQDDMSFRAQRSGVRNLLLVAASRPRCVEQADLFTASKRWVKAEGAG